MYHITGKREEQKPGTMRSRYQGTWNVIKFNWHFYLGSFIAILILACLNLWLPESISWILILFISGIVGTSLVSILATFYIYDVSSLYHFDWVQELESDQVVVNINAGFDETSSIVKKKLGAAQLIVLDFYDKKLHTEVSIERARKAYPPYPNTKKVATKDIPLLDNSVDVIIAFMSAHEIRNSVERIAFLTELKRVLKLKGELIIVEHIRDLPNFLAYNIGFLHFYSRDTWLSNFNTTGWAVSEEKITPFITKFTLRDGSTR